MQTVHCIRSRPLANRGYPVQKAFLLWSSPEKAPSDRPNARRWTVGEA